MKKEKKKKSHSTTFYMKSRLNPNNPNEEADYRNAREIAARMVEGYVLVAKKGGGFDLKGQVSKVHERMEEQWLTKMGLLDENGFVSLQKLQEFSKKDEEERRKLLDKESQKNSQVKP